MNFFFLNLKLKKNYKLIILSNKYQKNIKINKIIFVYKQCLLEKFLCLIKLNYNKILCFLHENMILFLLFYKKKN